MKILFLSLRSLMRFRLYTTINIIGLALSLACVIAIGRYVYSEMTTDHFNINHDRICLSVRHFPNEEQAPILFTTENILLKKNYKNPLDLPEVERMTAFVSLDDVSIDIDRKIFGAHVLATDSLFLQIFDFPLLRGERNRMLVSSDHAVISETFAQKVFGNANPIGKTIRYNEQILTIRGVTGHPSTQSSFSYDLLISKELQWRWPPVNYHTAVLLYPGTDIDSINRKLKASTTGTGRNDFRFEIVPFDGLYMNTGINKGENTFRQGSLTNIRVLGIAAVLILLTGLFNFIHISSAIILKRSRELGMKKVFGAQIHQLFSQLYIENFVLTTLALLLAWVVIEITHTWQTELFQIESILTPSFNIGLSAGILFGLPLFVTLFPILYYGRKNATVTLQNIQSGKNRIGSRSLFLVVQYCIACGLIVVFLSFMKQLNYMLDTDPGYRTKDIVKALFQRPSSIMSYSEEEIGQQENECKQILDAVKKSPLFTACTNGKSPYEFGTDRFNHTEANLPGQDARKVIHVTLSPDYFSVYNIQVPNSGLPVSEKEVLINETARKLLGKTSDVPFILEYDRYGEKQSCLVKGIIPDFQTAHLSLGNEPLIISIKEASAYGLQILTAAISPGRKQEAIRFLQDLHSKTVGGEFEYSFVEDEYKAIYSKDKQIVLIYGTFAGIAILIASLGLFSLSLFNIQQRFREIAIRKVNGADVSSIMRMLLQKYYRLLAIAFCIAVPIAWLAVHKYLEGFVHKTDISWWLFAIALLITACISLLTLIWQIRRAARMNPVHAIKSE